MSDIDNCLDKLAAVIKERDEARAEVERLRSELATATQHISGANELR
jgi:hypothetical protein